MRHMTLAKLALTLFCTPLAMAATSSSSQLAGDGDHVGSCDFEGSYAKGCIEFFGSGWDETSRQAYCNEKSKSGSTPVLKSANCARPDYNARCVTTRAQGLTHMYVNNLPSFICKKYMDGELERRPASGW